MHISYIKKRYRFLFLVLISTFILVFFSFIFSNKVLNIVLDEIVERASIPSDINFKVRQFALSFKDGIVLRDLVISKGDESISIPRIAVKKSNGSMHLRLDRASLNLDLVKVLTAISSENKDSKSRSLKINLNNINFFYQDKYLNIDKGFIVSNKNGLHWDLKINCCGLNFDSRGYNSFRDNRCFFNFKSNFIQAALIGEYDFKKGQLKGEFSFKNKNYNIGAKVFRADGLLNLSDIYLGPFSVPGPIEMGFEEELSFNWVIQDGIIDAKGLCSLKNEEEKINLYVRISKSKFKDYELITNFYIEYILNEKALAFKSVGTVVNKMPFPELSFKLALSDNSIVLENLDYEGGLSLSGYLDYNMNYSIKGDFNNFDLRHMMTMTMPLYARYLSVSRMDGSFSYFVYDGIKFTDIVLELQEGIIFDVTFDSGNVHLIGNSNILEFLNSELIIDGMPLAFEGNIDISKFPDASMWKDVVLTPLSSSYPFGKSSFEDKFGDKKLSLGTKLKDNVRLDYNVEFSADENYNKNEVSLEIIGSPYLKLRLREDEEIMGVEKNIKF